MTVFSFLFDSVSCETQWKSSIHKSNYIKLHYYKLLQIITNYIKTHGKLQESLKFLTNWIYKMSVGQPFYLLFLRNWTLFMMFNNSRRHVFDKNYSLLKDGLGI